MWSCLGGSAQKARDGFADVTDALKTGEDTSAVAASADDAEVLDDDDDDDDADAADAAAAAAAAGATSALLPHGASLPNHCQPGLQLDQ